ncbi:MAG: Na/Pi symporter [Paracoccaceae bacterium]|nr:Na/Pi symporter [Paracoccaceae bacterium]
METAYLSLAGGIGLFLFGMQTMTEALRELASRQVRRLLAGFTPTPTMGVLTGALTTAVIQSSSATTVTTIGFVGAGLMTFPQALGIIFGANIGTTITGWMVMLVGFKLKLGLAALPLLLSGSLMRVLGRGRVRQAGLALAGFSMIFVGLDMLQAGAIAFEGWVTPDSFPSDTLTGRLQLVGIGVALTVIMQSSSAGVATALVLLSSGTISFPQAAAMVIGMDIGTTFSAILASFGGSVAMRRTALAHVFYNVITGVIAFALLGFLAPFLVSRVMGGDTQAALVAFHTSFNVLGVILVLPMTGAFARLIEAMVPGHTLQQAEPLDPHLLTDAGAALDAASGAAQRVTAVQFGAVAAALRRKAAPSGAGDPLAEAQQITGPALEDLHAYLTRIAVPQGQSGPTARYAALLHQFDHMQRLHHRLGQSRRVNTLRAHPAMRRRACAVGVALDRFASGEETDAARLVRLNRLLGRSEARIRARVGGFPASEVFARTDAIRWLRRVCAHAERIAYYQGVALLQNPPATPALEDADEP